MRVACIIIASLVVPLGACECMYGGPGCGDPFVAGLCRPEIEAGSFVDVRVDYQDDGGRHPATVGHAVSHDPTIALVAQGPETGTITFIGRALGSASIELAIDGWDTAAQFVLKVSEVPAGCEDSEQEEAGFSISMDPKR